MRNTITEIKNLLDGFNSGLDSAEGSISELKQVTKITKNIDNDMENKKGGAT